MLIGGNTSRRLLCVLCRELKRLRDQESSRWCGQPVLSERYLLMSLLGKGGFSEVFKVGGYGFCGFVLESDTQTMFADEPAGE